MHINWFTLFAQGINFLLLVWLLQKFLYKPILTAIDEREKKITLQLKTAQEKETEADREKATFFRKNALFDQEKKVLMDLAVSETNVKRENLLEEARNEATILHSKLDQEYAEIYEKRKRDFLQKTLQEVFAMTRNILTRLASQSLEEQIVSIFIKYFVDLHNHEQKEFIDALNACSNPIVVNSGFDLSEKQRSDIKNAVSRILGKEKVFQFLNNPALIGGIELSANGYKLSWNIADYLNAYEKDIQQGTN
jgi:F-type H+-transporting ATPase subunit b